LRKELYKSNKIILLITLVVCCTKVLAMPIVARAKINYCLIDTINNNLITIKIKGMSASNVNGLIEVMDLKTNQHNSQSVRGVVKDTIINDNTESHVKLSFNNSKPQTFNKVIQLPTNFQLIIRVDNDGFNVAEIKSLKLKNAKAKKWKTSKSILFNDCNKYNQ
jgi:hypothetical protein